MVKSAIIFRIREATTQKIKTILGLFSFRCFDPDMVGHPRHSPRLDRPIDIGRGLFGVSSTLFLRRGRQKRTMPKQFVRTTKGMSAKAPQMATRQDAQATQLGSALQGFVRWP